MFDNMFTLTDITWALARFLWRTLRLVTLVYFINDTVNLMAPRWINTLFHIGLAVAAFALDLKVNAADREEEV